MHKALIILCLLFVPPCRADECNTLSVVDGLLGRWMQAGDRSKVVESWWRVSELSFEGRGEVLAADGVLKSGEDLRLVAMGGSVFYLAKVAHNELPVAFRLTQCDAQTWVFENAAHDFPKRIEYRLDAEGQRLTAHVSDGAEKGFSLRFEKQSED